MENGKDTAVHSPGPFALNMEPTSLESPNLSGHLIKDANTESYLPLSSMMEPTPLEVPELTDHVSADDMKVSEATIKEMDENKDGNASSGSGLAVALSAKKMESEKENDGGRLKFDDYNTKSYKQISALVRARRQEDPSDKPKSKSRASYIEWLREGDLKNEDMDEEFDNITGNLKKFTIFGKLPPELRHMIWKLTLEPRIITVHSEQVIGMPKLFCICSESRAIALITHECLREGNRRNKIYCNPLLDTFFFSNDIFPMTLGIDQYGPFLCPIEEKMTSKIRYLALESNFHFTANASLCFSKCKNLRELIMVPFDGRARFGRVYGPDTYTLDPIRGLNPEPAAPRSYVRELMKANFVKWGGSSKVPIPEVMVSTRTPFVKVQKPVVVRRKRQSAVTGTSSSKGQRTT